MLFTKQIVYSEFYLSAKIDKKKLRLGPIIKKTSTYLYLPKHMQSSQCMAIIGTNVLLSLIGCLLFFFLLENISLNEDATSVLYMKDKKRW